MYFIQGKLKGAAPIKFNRCDDPFGTLNTGKRRPTREQLVEAAKLKAHIGEKGLFFPRRGLKSCIINGCRTAGLKDGRKQLWPFMKAVLYVQDDLWFGRKSYDRIDEAFTTNKTMQMIPNFCPLIEAGWEAEFSLLILDDSLGQHSVRSAIETAGLVVGLGSGRPDYGRFDVTEWEVHKAMNGEIAEEKRV